jgi:hypothetical protein
MQVSVIMPAFNAARHVGAAIASTLAQTHADLELVVVDDGSTDQTAAIARAFAARDPRVRVVAQANAGIAGAPQTRSWPPPARSPTTSVTAAGSPAAGYRTSPARRPWSGRSRRTA